MASVFEKTAWKMGLYYDNAKKLLKMNEPFPAFLLKAWRNWPTLLGKHFCWFLNHLYMDKKVMPDLRGNNSAWQAMLASFARS